MRKWIAEMALCSSNDKITNEDRLSNMFSRLANSDAHFKHQQRDEPDLSVDEKKNIARSLFDKNISTFLSRFHRYLSSEDICNFESHQEDYEVAFYLNEIRKNSDRNFRDKIAKNRRFEAMKKMTSEGKDHKSQS